MPNQTLFPLDEPLAASPDRPEPALWIKQLVILSERDATAVIRDISFRRGLNIIKTSKRESGDNRVAGHSVGKTLLTRLIRYTLGEQHYATEGTQKSIQRVLPDGYVIAHWRVQGTDWIVVRPLGSTAPAESNAFESNDWHAGCSEDNSPYKPFLEAVHSAVFSDLPSFTLSKVGRQPRWQDILGWLARDHQCGYRKSNEWRHADANSGPSLDQGDNSLVMQWMVGLLSNDEILLRDKHNKLLEGRRKAKNISDREQRKADTLRPPLWAKLGIEEQPDVEGAEAPLLDPNPRKVAKDKITSFQRLKNERLTASTIENLRKQQEAEQAALIEAKAAVHSDEAGITNTEARIKQLNNSDAPSPYSMGVSYENCEAEDGCWMKNQEAAASGVDPAKEHFLKERREELGQWKQSLLQSKETEQASQIRFDDVKKNVLEERERLGGELAGIDREIGRWESYQEDVNSFQTAASTAGEQAKRYSSIDQEVDESLKVLGALREQQQAELNRFSSVYRFMLKEIFDENADGKIHVDGHGLRPDPDERLAPEGAALSVMTSVLAFDLASLTASVTGVGYHPRFLMHDSPREADMEEQLFCRLFEVAHDLESLSEASEPSFQYIVTTTTTPPEELADENRPFVRLTLDARDDDRLLLRRRF